MFVRRGCVIPQHRLRRRDVIGWMCPDTQESVQSIVPSHRRIPRRSKYEIASRGLPGHNLSQSLAEFLRKRHIVFSTIIYPGPPLSRANEHRRFRAISSTGEPRNARFDIPWSLSITKDAKVGRMIHIRTIREASVPPRNGNLRVYSREY